MTDIDIERLRQQAEGRFQHHRCRDECPYVSGWCAVLALIERLEKAERELACTKFKLTSLEGVYEDEAHERETNNGG